MTVEYLSSRGESPQDRFAFQRYLESVARGKSLFQLTAIAAAVTPWIRASWSARSFTKVITPVGEFDAVVCNISYHFNKHGAKFGSIFNMTKAARIYFKQNRDAAKLQSDGTLQLPKGRFELDGRIIWFG